MTGQQADLAILIRNRLVEEVDGDFETLQSYAIRGAIAGHTYLTVLAAVLNQGLGKIKNTPQ